MEWLRSNGRQDTLFLIPSGDTWNLRGSQTSTTASTTMQAMTKAQSSKTLLRVLLFCGILASLLNVSTDLLASTLYSGYSFTSQYVSELFAIGAPTSGLVVPLFTVYDVLLVAFASSVWMSAGRKRALRDTALMLAFPYGPQIGENLRTLWAGLAQRISTYAWLHWVGVLATLLLRAEGGQARTSYGRKRHGGQFG